MAHFCQDCGEKIQSELDSLCSECGVKINKKEAKSLDDFMTIKSKERTSHFSTNANWKKKKRYSNVSQHQQKAAASVLQSGKKRRTALIHVGLMKEERGNLSIVRGSKLPVEVCFNFNSAQVLSDAIKKHADFDQYFCALEDYVLLYPDQKVVDTVPGSLEEFSVSSYKAALAKPYSRLDFYISKLHDVTNVISADTDLDLPDVGEGLTDMQNVENRYEVATECSLYLLFIFIVKCMCYNQGL